MVPPYSHKVPRVLWYSGYCYVFLDFVYWTLTFFGVVSQRLQLSLKNHVCSPNPDCISTFGLGSSAFARRYLQNRFFFLLLWVLRCFSSPRFPSHTLLIHVWILRLFPLSEFPHSDVHGYNSYLQIPVAFRSLSRPSSALGAKAFTLCSS